MTQKKLLLAVLLITCLASFGCSGYVTQDQMSKLKEDVQVTKDAAIEIANEAKSQNQVVGQNQQRNNFGVQSYLHNQQSLAALDQQVQTNAKQVGTLSAHVAKQRQEAAMYAEAHMTTVSTQQHGGVVAATPAVYYGGQATARVVNPATIKCFRHGLFGCRVCMANIQTMPQQQGQYGHSQVRVTERCEQHQPCPPQGSHEHNHSESTQIVHHHTKQNLFVDQRVDKSVRINKQSFDIDNSRRVNSRQSLNASSNFSQHGGSRHQSKRVVNNPRNSTTTRTDDHRVKQVKQIAPPKQRAICPPAQKGPSLPNPPEVFKPT